MSKTEPIYTCADVSRLVDVHSVNLTNNLADGIYGFIPAKIDRQWKMTYHQVMTIMRVHKLTKLLKCNLTGAMFVIKLMEENLALKKELAKWRKES